MDLIANHRHFPKNPYHHRRSRVRGAAHGQEDLRLRTVSMLAVVQCHSLVSLASVDRSVPEQSISTTSLQGAEATGGVRLPQMMTLTTLRKHLLGLKVTRVKVWVQVRVLVHGDSFL